MSPIMRKRSVLMIAPHYWPSIGGIEKHIEEVIRILDRSKYSFTILTTQHLPNLPEKEIVENTTILRMPQFGNSKPHRSYLWMMKHRESILSHDIIHVHGVTPFLLWYLPTWFKF